MARGRHRGRVGGKRRQTTWIGPADQNTVNVSSGGSAIIASFDPAANFLEAPTIVRSRGQALVKLQAYSADLDFGGALGICVVTDEAFAAGAASIPRPFDDSDWGGWLVWRLFANRFELLDATGSLFPAGLALEIDSKAMRKVGQGETIVMMCESQTGAMSVAMHVRMLLMLS